MHLCIICIIMHYNVSNLSSKNHLIQSTNSATKIYLEKWKSSLQILLLKFIWENSNPVYKKMVDKVAAKAALMPVECRPQIKHGRRQLGELRKGKTKSTKISNMEKEVYICL